MISRVKLFPIILILSYLLTIGFHVHIAGIEEKSHNSILLLLSCIGEHCHHQTDHNKDHISREECLTCILVSSTYTQLHWAMEAISLLLIKKAEITFLLYESHSFWSGISKRGPPGSLFINPFSLIKLNGDNE
jgi:hypothetical protein